MSILSKEAAIPDSILKPLMYEALLRVKNDSRLHEMIRMRSWLRRVIGWTTDSIGWTTGAGESDHYDGAQVDVAVFVVILLAEHATNLGFSGNADIQDTVDALLALSDVFQYDTAHFAPIKNRLDLLREQRASDSLWQICVAVQERMAAYFVEVRDSVRLKRLDGQ